jgi:hypothetical protein
MRKTPILLAWAVALLSVAAGAQTTSQTAAPASAVPAPAAEPAPQAAPAPVAAGTAAPAQSTPGAVDQPGNTVEVPAGTKVLLALRSGVNTKTAEPGDGVYLSSTFPVIVKDHVVIPSGVYVQGVIDNVVRPGRVKGRAQVTMHFTTLIFPNGSVVSIPGAVDGIPGSDGPKVKKNGEGTIEQSGTKGKDAATVAKTTVAGAGIGGLAGIDSGHSGEAVGYGAAAGAAAGLLYTLFTRGSEVVLPVGQTIEMVFQRPLTLQESNLAAVPADVTTTAYVPAGKQSQPLPKPGRPDKVCPLGTLGCQ